MLMIVHGVLRGFRYGSVVLGSSVTCHLIVITQSGTIRFFHLENSPLLPREGRKFDLHECMKHGLGTFVWFFFFLVDNTLGEASVRLILFLF